MSGFMGKAGHGVKLKPLPPYPCSLDTNLSGHEFWPKSPVGMVYGAENHASRSDGPTPMRRMSLCDKSRVDENPSKQNLKNKLAYPNEKLFTSYS